MLRLSLIAIAIMAIILAAIPSLLWVIVWLIGLCFGAHVPFAPFGRPLSSVSFKDNEGWYEGKGQSLYINRGLGCTMPLRLNCPAEITVITLRK